MTSPKNGRKTFSQLSQLVHGRGNGWAIQITKPRSKETALDSGKSARGSINSLRQFKVQWVLGGVLKKIKFLGCRDPGLKICALKDRSCPVTELEGEGTTP